jgi:outer membrane receptor protein involved in Fe transport
LVLSWALSAVSFLPLAATPASAQATTGTLRGVVADPNGAVINGATVTAKNEATGATSSPTTTSSEGIFEIAGLQPGTYTVTTEGAGFKRSVSTGVVVKVGIVNPLDVMLEAGAVTETITVTANTEEVVQREQAQISTTFEARRVEDLPSNGAGNGLDTLALLAPGVVANRGGSGNTNGTGLSVNGNRGRSNNFQIDGADNNDLSVSGPAMFVDNQDQVQEYQVITNNFSAQYGRNQGAIVNIVTKGGTNEYHGTAFWFHQNNKALNSLTNQEKASGQTEPNQSLYNVFGGTFGGPLHLPRFGEGGPSLMSGKDRMFFFLTYQGIRNPSVFTARSTQLAILESEFGRLSSTFPGNGVVNAITNFSTFAIPGARPNSQSPGAVSTVFINPTLTGNARLSATPAPGFQGPFLIGGPYDVVNLGGNLFQAAQAERDFPTPFTETNYSLRFDFKPTDRDNVTVRLLNQRQTFVNSVVGNAGVNGFNGDVPATSRNFGGTWTRTLSNAMVNEFRAFYQRIGVTFGGGEGLIPDPLQIGSTITNITFPSGLGITKPSNTLATIGPATNFPQGRIGKVYQVADNLTWTVGRHSMIMGAEFKHLNNVSPFLPNYNGAFAFNSATRIINNAPSGVTVTGGDPLLAYTENDQYYFFQDDFKIRPNLTLNLGLRYEYTGQPINILHEQSVARESNPATALFDPTLPLSVRTVPRIPADKNNFAPRVGFAYTPKFWRSFLGEDATVIRGGFSIAYDAAFYNILQNVQGGAPFSVSLAIPANLLPTTNSPFPVPNGAPTGDAVRAAGAASGVLPIGKLNPQFLAQTTVSQDFYSPYSMQFSMGVQRQFGRRHVGEVRYVGTRGVGLFQNINDNFFIGPLVNGFTRNVTFADGADADADPDVVPFAFRSFANLLPPGTTALVCADNPATLTNEAACNNRLRPAAGITTRANTANSIYHSMQSRYNGRLTDTFSVGLSYTFSKTIDDASEIFAQNDALSPNAQNPFCINRCERAISALDRTHAFAANFIYDVPWMREQRGFVGRVLGGWQVNGTYLLTSGAPYTPGQTFNGNLGLGGTYLTAGDRPFLGNPNADKRLVGINQVDASLLFGVPVTNPNGFYSLNALNSTGDVVGVTPNDVRFIFNGPGAAQVFGTPFGDSPRNALRGPIFNQLNASLFKNIKVMERLTVQLRGEAFNVLNHPNPGFGVVVPNGANAFPQINVGLAGSPGNAFAENKDIEYARRVVQVGLRIIF